MEIIKPEDMKDRIPEEIITVFNDLIRRNFSGHIAVVKQEEVVEELYERYGMDRKKIFKEHLLDVEDIYGEYWDVVYDKPGYNESYDAFFEFKIK